MTHVTRSIEEPIRTGLRWDDQWAAEDQGMIISWEVGRKIRENYPDIREKVEAGKLPVLGWKGGMDLTKEKYKTKKKYGTLWYYAQLLGILGKDLDVKLDEEYVLTCSQMDVTVTYTHNSEKYKNA